MSGGGRPDHDADALWARRARSFGAVADDYERFRPGYPDALFDDLVTAAGGPIGPWTAVDVGAGTGRVSVALARRTAQVTALEPDARMAAVARRSLGPWPGAAVVEARLEDYEGPLGATDLVTAGQSWHWVDARRGPAAAHRLLHPGGALGLFWNVEEPLEPDLQAAVEAAYRRHAPDLVDDRVPSGGRYGGHLDALTASGLFEELETRQYPWRVERTAEAFVGLRRTHSNHLLLMPAQLDRLSEDLAAAVARHGGIVSCPHTSVLFLTRARPS